MATGITGTCASAATVNAPKWKGLSPGIRVKVPSAKNINESTAMIAGILGSLKSAIADRGIVVEAPIENSKNYMNVDED